MREIKFRVREIATGDWIIGSLCPQDDEVSLAVFFACIRVGRFDIKTLGQFTELPDKNGVEIYGGDICRNKDFGFISLVVFDKGMFGVSSKGRVYPLGDPRDWEVIGNIYENKELLDEIPDKEKV